MSFTVVNLIKGHTAPFKSLDLRKRSVHIGQRCVATHGISRNCVVAEVKGLRIVTVIHTTHCKVSSK